MKPGQIQKDTQLPKGQPAEYAAQETKVFVPETMPVINALADAIDNEQQKKQVLAPPAMRRICACGSLTCPDGPWYGWMWIKG